MATLSQRYNQLTSVLDVSKFQILSELKEFHTNITGLSEELSQDANDTLETLQVVLGKLNESTGFREKKLGGLFGNKEAATKLKNTKNEIEETEALFGRIDEWSQQLTDAVFEQAIDIIACGDGEFVTLVTHSDLMKEALEFTKSVLTEVNEAIEALNEAEDAEEWDQMTSSSLADWESDDANAEAADEVNDVTNILLDYREFLQNIGENDAAYLESADFDFDWGDMLSDEFFGDFWGSEMMLNKINQAQDDMVDLRNKISQLYNSFAADYDQAAEQVSDRVDEDWEAA